MSGQKENSVRKVLFDECNEGQQRQPHQFYRLQMIEEHLPMRGTTLELNEYFGGEDPP